MKPHIFAAIAFLALPLLGEPLIKDATAEPQRGQQVRQRDNMRFRAMDINNDGVITRDEWRGSARAFRNNDWNGDGVLSGDEVRPGARRGQAQAEFDDWTVAAFRSLDHDGNGRITRDEWHHDVASFARADHNRDGMLTRAEFLGSADEDQRGSERAQTGETVSGTSGVTQPREVAVEAQRRWTDTGIDVNAGDTIEIRAHGTIILSDGPNDLAEPVGARSNRRAPGAPLPSMAAGALIGRVGESEPFFIGDQQRLGVRNSGRLYLGINDDYLGDNRGGFSATIRVTR